jgi:hypothetical protein
MSATNLPRGYRLGDFAPRYQERIRQQLQEQAPASHPNARAGDPSGAAGPASSRPLATISSNPRRRVRLPQADVAPPAAIGPHEQLRDWLRGIPEARFGWPTLLAVMGVSLAVLAGALWAEPTIAPAGAVLLPSTTGRLAAWLLRVTHASPWLLAPLVAAAGAVVYRRGGRLLLAVARIAALVGALAVAWAVIRG